MSLPTLPIEASKWDQALYAFLVEKGNRSGSRRTVESYSRMLWRFFAHTTPDQVTPPDVLSYAHGIGLLGKPPGPVTIGARIACLSSYFRFLQRMGLVTSNPCDMVERPRQSPAPARGFSADEVKRLLAVVPDTVEGRRDRAILLVFILTGRRRTEVMELKAGDIEITDGTVLYSYRGKGGKRGRRELPKPAWDAIRRTLEDCGKGIATMDPAESLWQAGAPRGLSGSTFYARFRRYLVKAGLEPGPRVRRGDFMREPTQIDRRLPGGRLLRSLLVTTVAIGLVGGGLTVANHFGHGEWSACVNKGGDATKWAPNADPECNKNEKQLHLSAEGPQGEKGIQGEKGEKGNKGDAGPGVVSTAFVLSAGGTTCRSGSKLRIDNALANGKPGAIVVVTPRRITPRGARIWVTYQDVATDGCAAGFWHVNADNLVNYNVIIANP